MDKLPVEITTAIYEYDPTYKHMVDKVLKQMIELSFIHRCSECFKPWNSCYCYCSTCRTYLRVCRQIYFDKDSLYEDGLNDIVQLGC